MEETFTATTEKGEEELTRQLGEAKEPRYTPRNIFEFQEGEKIAGMNSLMELAKNYTTDCKDITIPADSLRVMTTEDNKLLITDTFPEEETQVMSSLSRWSLDQLCNRYGIPVRYMRKCMLAKRLDLLKGNINGWLSRDTKPVFLRSYRDRVRGFLSSKFVPFDSIDVLNCLQELPQIPYQRFSVQASYLDEERINLRLVDVVPLNLENDKLYVGLNIRDSDVGKSSFEAGIYIFRLVCQNGLMTKNSEGYCWTRKHVGLSREMFFENLGRIVTNMNQVRHIIEYHYKNLQKPITKIEMSDLITGAIQKLELAEEKAFEIETLTEEKYTVSTYGFINALTEIAQTYAIEKRERIETYAGTFLPMSAPEKPEEELVYEMVS